MATPLASAGVDPPSTSKFTCPRCGALVEARFYGPCDDCRAALRDTYRRAGRVVEVAEYEPKMNVTPNAVATKDD